MLRWRVSPAFCKYIRRSNHVMPQRQKYILWSSLLQWAPGIIYISFLPKLKLSALSELGAGLHQPHAYSKLQNALTVSFSVPGASIVPRYCRGNCVPATVAGYLFCKLVGAATGKLATRGFSYVYQEELFAKKFPTVAFLLQSLCHTKILLN